MLRHTNGRTKDPKKKGFFGKFHKTKSVGKPRTRWEDVRRDALEILGIRGWMKRAGKNGRASLEGGQVSKGAVAPHVDVLNVKRRDDG